MSPPSIMPVTRVHVGDRWEQTALRSWTLGMRILKPLKTQGKAREESGGAGGHQEACFQERMV